MVRKIWNDGGDEQHREPVKLQVYNRATSQPYDKTRFNNTITLGEDGIWYEVVWIPKQLESSSGADDGVDSADDIYIVEEAMIEGEGDSQVLNNVIYNTEKDFDSLYPSEDAAATEGTINSVTTSNHRYQVTYTYEAADADSGGDTGWAKFAVTNRRLGWIDIDVTKTWQRDDMDDLILEELNKLKEKGTTLALAVKLSFVDGETDWEITNKGINSTEGDTVQLGENAEKVQITGQNKTTPVTSVQALIMPGESGEGESITEELYFYNLPKYDQHAI